MPHRRTFLLATMTLQTLAVAAAGQAAEGDNRLRASPTDRVPGNAAGTTSTDTRSDAGASSQTLTRVDVDAAAAARVRGLAGRLQRESQAAFDRGLLGLRDHGEHVASATALQTQLAALQNAPALRDAALRAEVDLWERNALRLAQLQQPAARGWGSDVLLARVYAARARLAVSVAERNAPAVARHSQELEVLTEQHVQSRRMDYQDGLASVTEMTDAILLRAGATPPGSGSGQRLREGQAALRELVDRAAPLQSDRFAPGATEMLYARLQLARLEGREASLRGDSQRATAALGAAQTISDEWFESLRANLTRDTGSLYDLGQAWNTRQSLRADSRGPEAIMAARRVDLDRDRRDLSEAMQSVVDLRGRRAADVAYVEAIGVLQDLRDQERRELAEAPQERPSKRGAAVYEETPERANRNTPAANRTGVPERAEPVTQPAARRGAPSQPEG